MARQTLYSRLARHERAEDTQLVLKRMFQAMDESYDRIESAAEILLKLISIDNCPDAFLFILAQRIKYEWRSDKSYLWNRDRLSESIRRYSRKGTRPAQHSIIREHGGDTYTAVDMASTLLVLGRQGRLGRRDCVLIGPDFYHDGSFLFHVDFHLDTTAFYEEFEKQRPAGRLWWYRITQEFFGECQADISFDEHQIDYLHNLGEGVLGRTLINFLPLPHYPNGSIHQTDRPVEWQWTTNHYDGALGSTLINALPLPYSPNGSFEQTEGPVEWQWLMGTREGTLGNGRIGIELTLGMPPAGVTSLMSGDVSAPMFGAMGGLLWADSLLDSSFQSIYVTDEAPSELAGLQTGFDMQEIEV